MRASEGNVTMKEIAGYVRSGAMAYLRQQYKVVIIVFVILAAFFAVLAYAVCFHYWRFLLRSGRIYRYEDCDLCFGKDSRGGT